MGGWLPREGALGMSAVHMTPASNAHVGQIRELQPHLGNQVLGTRCCPENELVSWGSVTAELGVPDRNHAVPGLLSLILLFSLLFISLIFEGGI